MQLSDGKLFSEMMQMISLAQSRSQAVCTECFQIIVAFHCLCLSWTMGTGSGTERIDPFPSQMS